VLLCSAVFTTMTLATPAQAIQVEPNADVYREFSGNTAVFDEAAGIIRLHGYRCDSISGFNPY
jgi:hypothetical protein